MDSLFDIIFKADSQDSGYKDNDEYISDEIKVVDMMLSYYHNRVSDEIYEIVKSYASDDLGRARSYIENRLNHTEKNVFLAGKYLEIFID